MLAAMTQPLSQAQDFRAESEALFALLADQPAAVFAQETQFKAWTINDVIGHLHLWNWAARLSLADPEGFQAFLKEMGAAFRSEGSWRAFERGWVKGLAGQPLLAAWRADMDETAAAFAVADPKARLAWVGPPMSARSSITARMMETWAHAQAVFDLLGVERAEHDRLINIAQLGVNTFGWTFQNRAETPPGPAPEVRLTAPSGVIWRWNEGAPGLVEGPAVDFCRIVTQTRAAADTAIRTQGETAARWMAIAQCFAGPPNDPPAPGTRFRRPAAPT